MKTPPLGETSNFRANVLIMAMAGFVSVICGCEKPRPVIQKFNPPSSITIDNQEWVIEEPGVSEADNRKIDRFFKSRPDLLGSPEWDGQPNKYVNAKSKKRTRLYWFSGTIESPSWNGIEFDGTSMKQFSGDGNPDAG